MEEIVLYADYEIDSVTNDMFVITPEGNYYNFPGSSYDETHENIMLVDITSHKKYTIVFNE